MAETYIGALTTTSTLGSLDEGSIVQINENGSPVEFYVAKHDYEADLNGSGRTLLVRKDIYDYTNRLFNNSLNTYADGLLDVWFNGTYKALLDEAVQTAIGTTSFYSAPGNSNYTPVAISRSVFTLSVTEYGHTNSSAPVEGTALPIASTLQVAKLNGSADRAWTRSPYTGSQYRAWFTEPNGGIAYDSPNSHRGSRPCFTLPADIGVFNGIVTGAPAETKMAARKVTDMYVGALTTSSSLGSMDEGATVKINENGSPVEFLVVKHNYESELNGNGRTLLLRKNVTDLMGFGSSNVYENSTMDSWFNGTYKAKLDANVQNIMGETKFKYTPDSSSTAVSVMSRSVFALSVSEYGLSGSNINSAEGVALQIAHDHIEAYKDDGNIADYQWTRSLALNTAYSVVVSRYASIHPVGSGSNYPVRPALTLPANVAVIDGLITGIFAGTIMAARKVKKAYIGVSTPFESLGRIVEGETVKINENGSPVEFYVAKHDYEAGLNGSGRTLLVRKDLHSWETWDSNKKNTYVGSTIDTWLNNDYFNALPAELKSACGLTTIECTINNSTSTVQKGVFLLSTTELGVSSGENKIEGEPLPIASTLRIATLNGVAKTQWVRTPTPNCTDLVDVVTESGVYAVDYANGKQGRRPCFTLPADLGVFDGVITGAKAGTKDVARLCFSSDMPLSDLPEGAIVNITENGVDVPFYLAKHDYESGLNGAGRTLFVRKNYGWQMMYKDSSSNDYQNSLVNSWLNNTYIHYFSDTIKQAIGTTSFYVTYGSSLVTRSYACFIPSLTEMGLSSGGTNIEGERLPVADTIRILYNNSNPQEYWTRTRLTSNSWSVCTVTRTGTAGTGDVGNNSAVRPCFTLPSELSVNPTPNADGSYTLLL